MNHEAILALISELYVNLSQTNAKLQAALARVAELEKDIARQPETTGPHSLRAQIEKTERAPEPAAETT
jgi:hypothetical protein